MNDAAQVDRAPAFEPTPHPVFPLKPIADVARMDEDGRRAYANYLVEREEAIRLSGPDGDPFRHAVVLDWWKDAAKLCREFLLTVLLGGNGCAKTFFGAWFAVHLLAESPRKRVLFLHENDTSSVLVHQAAVWHFIPAEWKQGGRSKSASVLYDPKNGFSNNRFLMANGSIGQFGNYNQDVGAYEGTGWDLIVADENMPLPWLKTLLIRLPRCGGKMLWTYTPIMGLTKTVKHVTDGARTVRSRRAVLLPPEHRAAPGLPPGEMPVEQEPLDNTCRIRYVFSEENPFSGYEEFAKLMRRASLEEIERRAYGFARNTRGSNFPKFGPANLFDELPVGEPLTRYLFADPHGLRPVFMIWVAVDSRGRHFIYREWPDVPRFGEWAVESETGKSGTRFDGDAGPGQQPLGKGVLDYKEIILHEEGARWNKETHAWDYKRQERVMLRYGDPRAIKDQAIADETGATSFTERMRETQKDAEGNVVGPPLDFLGAPGLKVDVGVQAINDLLSYDQEQPVTAHVNEPRLYVSRTCRNVIWCLQNWTGRDGEKGASKDPVDCVRYMATQKLQYVDASLTRGRRGGSY